MNQQLFEEIKDLFYEFGKIEPPNMECISTDNLRDEIKKLFVVALQNFDNEMFAEKAYCVKQLIRPNSLFQYRKFDIDGYSLKALENNYVWLSAPSNFNDPYDCSACFDFDKMAAAYFLNNNKNSKNPKVQKLIEDLKNGKSFFDEDYQNPFLNQLNDSLKDESQKNFTNTQTNLGIKAK